MERTTITAVLRCCDRPSGACPVRHLVRTDPIPMRLARYSSRRAGVSGSEFVPSVTASWQSSHSAVLTLGGCTPRRTSGTSQINIWSAATPAPECTRIGWASPAAAAHTDAPPRRPPVPIEHGGTVNATAARRGVRWLAVHRVPYRRGRLPAVAPAPSADAVLPRDPRRARRPAAARQCARRRARALGRRPLLHLAGTICRPVRGQLQTGSTTEPPAVRGPSPTLEYSWDTAGGDHPATWHGIVNPRDAVTTQPPNASRSTHTG
jgi:hypothetical protein